MVGCSDSHRFHIHANHQNQLIQTQGPHVVASHPLLHSANHGMESQLVEIQDGILRKDVAHILHEVVVDILQEDREDIHQEEHEEIRRGLGEACLDEILPEVVKSCVANQLQLVEIPILVGPCLLHC